MKNFVENSKIKKLFFAIISELICFFIIRINLIKYENYDKASEYLAALEEISPDNPFVYYNYYKINCLKENFEEAYINLHKCRELNSKEYNVTLPITMLEMLLDMKYNYSLFSNTNSSSIIVSIFLLISSHISFSSSFT